MTQFVSIACCKCKEVFGLHPDTYAVLKRSSKLFHCPHGHEQYFAQGKSDAEKLQEQLEDMRRQRDRARQEIACQADRATAAERSARAQKGLVTRLKNRVHAGLCTCCNRSFQNLARHMATKHADQKESAQ